MLEEIYCYGRLPKDPEDFWKLNVELSYLAPFYKFKKEKDSARIMTAIWMLCDPKSSLVESSVPEEKIKEDLNKSFFTTPIKWADYSEYIRAYKDQARTKLEKELDSFFLILKERQQAGADLDWDSDFDKKDKIISSQDTYYDKYFTIRSKLKGEQQENLTHGKYTPSLLEARG